MRKVYLRILPFAVLTYFFCYLDRINVGFASLTMNKEIGLDAAWYGMAAGAFFWGYVLFEVPSNIILEKVGARIWIARIMVTWGIVSGCTALAVGSRRNGYSAAALAPRIARQRRSGVAGISTWRMPSGESASTSALATAGIPDCRPPVRRS